MLSLDCKHGGCINVCFKQSHRDSRHCGKNTTALRKILLVGAPTLKCCSQMDFKGTQNNGKDLLTNQKDPIGLSIKGLKRPFIEKSISKDLKDLKGSWEHCDE